MALAAADCLSFSYPAAERPALDDVSFTVDAGEVVALLGGSGSGKTTLLRALAALVPHFHGGRFSGRVEVAGRDTRTTRPAELAGTVASVFQDPEDQVVMTVVENEIAFGLENVGTSPAAIGGRVEAALRALGSEQLRRRRTTELSGGELQRVCLASALALEPALLLLDEPMSQLDHGAAAAFLDAISASGAAVVLAEHRVERAFELADRVVFMEEGRILLDAPRDEAERWLSTRRPAWVSDPAAPAPASAPSDPVVTIENGSFSYRDREVLRGASLVVRRGEVVVLEGPNGSGKTTLAKLAAGLLEPAGGSVRRRGRTGYLSQDPGRYVVEETTLAEAALGVGGDGARARSSLARVGLEWAEDRHPRDLSSGERERLGLAAVSVAEPDLLVLDEPTRGVDPERKAQLAEWLQAYAAAGRGVLVATHDRSFPAHRRIDLERTKEHELVGV